MIKSKHKSRRNKRNKNLHDKFWTSDRFTEEKNAKINKAGGFAIVTLICSMLLCVFFKHEELILWSFFIAPLVWIISEKYFFNKWKAEVLSEKQMSHTLFKELAIETNSDQVGVISPAKIAFLVIVFGLVLTTTLYEKIKKDELNAKSDYAIGKVVAMFEDKTSFVRVEFDLNGLKFYGTKKVMHERYSPYFFYDKNRMNSLVRIGDLFKVKYSPKDPSNCEVIGDMPLPQK